MADDDVINAQLVMIRDDGSSILEDGPSLKDTSPERRTAISARLESLGFQVVTGDGNTLSISGSADRFAEVFGLDAKLLHHGLAASASKIPEQLEPYVADVFVPPTPELFR
ncbi:hypothetical protein [Amaricoccus tamworthensis]|uniref:hypothetical protein n=1 Tax=Amaricoccus tamworthensis TaxID=57002 RepID=UPI003C7981CB